MNDMPETVSVPEPAKQTPQPFSWMRDVLPLLIILALGAGLRVWYLEERMAAPDFAAPLEWADLQDYHAHALATGDWAVREGLPDPKLQEKPFLYAPGYVLRLACLYRLTGENYLVPRMAGSVIGLASVVLLFLLMRLVFTRGPALLAALFLATYWGFFFWEQELDGTATAVFLSLAGLHLSRLWWTRRKWGWALAGGFVWGLCAVVRPSVLLFAFVIFLWMLFAGRGTKRSAVLFAAACLLTIAPVTLRNYLVSGEFVPISARTGMDVYIGSGAEADGISPWSPWLQRLEGTGQWSAWTYGHVIEGLGRELGTPDLGQGAASRYFIAKTLRDLRADPVRALALLGRKALLFFSPLEIAGDRVVQVEKEQCLSLRYMPGFQAVMMLFLSGLWVLFYFRLRGTRLNGANGANAMLFLLLAFAVCEFLMAMPFRADARARMLAAMCMLAVGALGANALLTALWKRSSLAVLGAAGMASIYVVAGIPLTPYEPDLANWHCQRAECRLRTGDLDQAAEEGNRLLGLGTGTAYMHFRLGEGFLRVGRTAEAEAHFRAGLKADPKFQDMVFMLARTLAATGQNNEAMLRYEEALRLNSEDARAHHEFAELLAAAGRDDEAIPHYEEAVRIVPDFPHALEGWGRLLAKRGQTEQAAERFEKVLALEPENQDVHYLLGLARAKLGQRGEAIRRFGEAIALNPEDARARNALGQSFAEAGRLDDALAQFEEAVRYKPDFALALNNWGNLLAHEGRADEAEAKYREALRVRPEDEYAWHNLALLYDGRGDFDKAVECYQNALRNNPGNSMIPNDLGNLCARFGKEEDAVRWYRRAIEVDPNNPFAWNNLGLAAQKAGTLDEAIEDYRHALNIAPELLLALNNLAAALAAQGKNDEAFAVYEKAVAARPNDGNLHNALGYQFFRRGNLDKAAAEYAEALRLIPAFPLACNNLGNVYAAQGKHEEAIAQYRKALDVDPKDPLAHANIAALLEQTGQTEAALEEYPRAIENDPNNAALLTTYGNALAQAGRTEDAIAQYRHALEKDANYTPAHCNLGIVLLGTGAKEDAAAQFHRVLELDPKNATAKEGLRQAK